MYVCVQIDERRKEHETDADRTVHIMVSFFFHNSSPFFPHLRVQVVLVECGQDPPNTPITAKHNHTKLLKPLKQLNTERWRKREGGREGVAYKRDNCIVGNSSNH